MELRIDTLLLWLDVEFGLIVVGLELVILLDNDSDAMGFE